MMISSQPSSATSKNAFFRVGRRSILSASEPYSTRFRDATQRGVKDLRDAITLEELKLVLAAGAEWQRLTMPNVDPGKGTSQ